MKRKMQSALILSQEEIADQIYSMWLQESQIADTSLPGQFISVYSSDSGRMLPRPISICETDPAKGAVRLVYRIAGAGTREFASCRAGESLDILGPLGNGFPVGKDPEKKRVLLIGGGIGIPPMVMLGKSFGGKAQILAGYRDKLFLTEELAACGQLYISTEDGSCGTKGTVLDCIRENDLHADVIYACGPAPMLRALQAYASERQIECWLSLEERMACGIGACLGCVCESTRIDEHSQVRNKRVCKDGPVFRSTEVVI